MMPKLSFDLPELWSDFKTLVKLNYNLLTKASHAPPTTRHLDLAFVVLLDKNEEVVGCFVPELYEIAKIDGLCCQNKNSQSHDRKKSPFELSVLPVNYSDDVDNSARPIQKRCEKEFSNGSPLPPPVYKYQIVSDYLRDLNKIGLHPGNCRSIALNIANPPQKTTLLERIMHYVAQHIALALTLTSALVMLDLAALHLCILPVIGIVLAQWCGNAFGTYSAAETILREIQWLSSDKLRWGDKISVKKLIKTGILLSALVAAMVGVFTSTFEIFMLLPIPTFVYPLATTLFNSLFYLTAGFVAGISALVTGTSALTSIRYFWGFGIWDNQIDFSKENADSFKPLPKKDFNAVLKKQVMKLQDVVEKLPNDFNVHEQTQHFLTAFCKLAQPDQSELAQGDQPQKDNEVPQDGASIQLRLP